MLKVTIGVKRIWGRGAALEVHAANLLETQLGIFQSIIICYEYEPENI